jgi:hypothetical protein
MLYSEQMSLVGMFVYHLLLQWVHTIVSFVKSFATAVPLLFGKPCRNIGPTIIYKPPIIDPRNVIMNKLKYKSNDNLTLRYLRYNRIAVSPPTDLANFKYNSQILGCCVIGNAFNARSKILRVFVILH